MKKQAVIAGLLVSTLFVACGPSAEQKATEEKRKADSAAAAIAAQATADSLKQVEEAAAAAEKMKADSVAAAEKAKMMEDSIAAAAKAAGKKVVPKVVKPAVKENKGGAAGRKDAVPAGKQPDNKGGSEGRKG